MHARSCWEVALEPGRDMPREPAAAVRESLLVKAFYKAARAGNPARDCACKFGLGVQAFGEKPIA